MFLTASIKPTSSVQNLWTARSQTCGFLQGVCFVRTNTKAGPRYVAEKLTESQVHQLKNNVAVVLAVSAIRMPEKVEEIPAPAPPPVIVAPEQEPVEEDEIKIPLPPKRLKTK